MSPNQFKDLFSTQAKIYSRVRPHYPDELFAFLSSLCEEKELVWDCATGNGQAAKSLTKFFDRIIATDASEKQLKLAKQHHRITYQMALAENSGLISNSVDLVTVATAAHWFKLPEFYAEANRVLKPGAVLAVWCYGPNIYINQDIENLLKYLNNNILGEYISPGFEYVQQGYENLPFPYELIEAPQFFSSEQWNLTHLTSFIDSWSMTQNYLKANGSHPIEKILPDLMKAWGNADEVKEVRFPLFIKVGKKAV